MYLQKINSFTTKKNMCINCNQQFDSRTATSATVDNELTGFFI